MPPRTKLKVTVISELEGDVCGNCTYYRKLEGVKEPFMCFANPPVLEYDELGQPSFVRGGCIIPPDFPACHLFSVKPIKVN